MSIIRQAYRGSDGQLTLRVYGDLLSSGPNGELAVLLLRAMKASSRAKVYRKRQHTRLSYERKAESIKLLAEFLEQSDGEFWGWKVDPDQRGFPWVLYCELPTGQVSFHSAQRYSGPDFKGEWDRSGKSEIRIILFAESCLEEARHE